MARTQLTTNEILDDSLTGDDIDESTIDASKIPFSNAGFVSTDVKNAIIEARQGGIKGDIMGTMYANLVVPDGSYVVCHNLFTNGYNITLNGGMVLI